MNPRIYKSYLIVFKMRIVKLNETAMRVVNELRNMKSNEAGKLIQPELLQIEEVPDWQEKNLFLACEVFADLLRDFVRYCRDSGKNPCLIIFTKNIDVAFLKDIIGAGVSRDSILFVGARNLSAKEMEFLAENKIRNISLNLFLINIEEATDFIMEFASGKELFLTFDISILEQIEFGGLTSRQAIYCLGRMSMMKNLKGVLLSGIDEKISSLAARLLAELL